MAEIIKLGCAYSNPDNRNDNGRGTVYSRNGIISTMVTMLGGGNHPMTICKIKHDINEEEGVYMYADSK